MYDLEATNRRERVLLVGVGRDPWAEENSLEELARLAKTAGTEVVETVFQRRKRMDTATFVGKGKAFELKEISETLKIDALIFDDDLTPAQGRNLEEIFERKVIDRSELILDIFVQHARTKEAKIEVELAQLYYRLPRLVGKGITLSRLGGGIGTRGPGEQKLEVDRRRIRERISHLKKELKGVERSKALQRKGRENLFRIALVGYTNAGKSTLMNRLTQAEVKVEEGLFSTLDSTTRRLEIGIWNSSASQADPARGWGEGNRGGGKAEGSGSAGRGTPHSTLQLPHPKRVLITDTVGFIRKLPHHLITSFHSTLQEAVEADLRLHLVDVSHPDVLGQMETAQGILEHLGCLEKSILYVFNKIDRADTLVVEKFLATYQPSCAISAIHGDGMEGLEEAMIHEMDSHFVEREILLLPGQTRLLSQVYQLGEVVERSWLDGKVRLKVRMRKENFEGFMKSLKG
ncbi:GTPase HflX [candidate division TA06 bacterium]|nr:GTPase HflX [candidate division TA06 bacterium]